MNIYTAVKNTGLPNYAKAKIVLPSSINHKQWEILLGDYHDKIILEYLKYGWPIGYESDSIPTPTYKNHASATRFPAHVRSFIEKEIQERAMLGPFSNPPFAPWCQISPLMTRPKKDTEERRIIVDLSYPEGASINDGITKNQLEGQVMEYNLPTLSTLTQAIKNLGPKVYMWKADLRRAYRQMRCCPLSYPFLGIQLDNVFYLDICPSFGCRLSGGAQMRISAGIGHIFTKMTGSPILFYVDDFISWSTNYDKAMSDFKTFHSICEQLGMELAKEKSISPTFVIDWLGFNVNSNAMTVEIPKNKLNDIIVECQDWATRPSATRKQIQSLAGKLAHICQVIQHGRKFMARILSTLSKAPPHGQYNIDDQFRADVKWFIHCAMGANCLRLMSPQLPTVEIECDSSLQGAGAFSSTLKLYYTLTYNPIHAQPFHISQLEAMNVVNALKTMIPANAPPLRIRVKTDNSPTMFSINTGKTKDAILASCAREVALFSAKYQHEIELYHAPGVSLVLSDALSRMNMNNNYKIIAQHFVKELNLSRVEPLPIIHLLSDV